MDGQLSATHDETLSPYDAVDVLEEILEAQNHARYIGLKLKVPRHVVDGILNRYAEPRDQLLCVIEEFLNHTDPRPTWRALAGALRSRTVDLPRLAEEIERKYCSRTAVRHEQGIYIVHNQEHISSHTAPEPLR